MRKFFLIAGLIFGLVGNVQAQTDMGGVRATFAGAVAKVMPSVVNIYANKKVSGKGASTYDPMLDRMLTAPTRQRMEQSLGSGVLVRTDGTLVTNLHVIQGASAIVAVLADGREFPAQFVNGDEKLDLAVLKLVMPTNERLPVAKFGNADTLKVGDVVLALGNPYGLGQSVSLGVVSAVDRTNRNLSQYGQFIQTDATINPGNSGGALIDSTGVVVGINTAIFSRTGGSQGIGFAVPAQLVEAVVNGITTTGHVVRPWLGLTGQPLTEAIGSRLGIEGGVMVAEVSANSPAHKAGVKVGDVLVAFDGLPVNDQPQLADRVLAAAGKIGQTVSMTILRAGTRQELAVQLETLPVRKASDKLTIGGRHALSGYTVELLSPALNDALDLPQGTAGVAVVTVPPGDRRVFGFNLQEGDVILSLNKVPVTDLTSLSNILEGGFTRGMLIRILRGGKTLTLVAKQ